MSKGIKLLLSLFIILTVLAGSTIYFVSTQINPEVIRKVTVETIEKSLKGVKADIKLIDYSLGTSVTVNIKKILLTDKKDKSKFLELNEIAVKIPLLAILTSGGTIEVLTDAPKVYVQKKGDEINWIRAIGGNTVKKEETKNKKSKEIVKADKKIELPAFVKKSKLNLRLKNLELLLDMGPQQRSKVGIEKIVVKNLNFENSSAFEIASNIKFQLEKNKFFKTNIQVIGELTLKDLIEKNIINTKTTFSVSKTKLDGLPIKIPLVKGSAKINGTPENLVADLKVNIDNISDIATKVSYGNNSVEAKDIAVELTPKAALNLLGNDLKSSLKMINLDGVKLALNGNANVTLDPLTITPNLKFKTIKKIGVNIDKGIDVENSISGMIRNKNVNVSVDSEVFGGKVKTEVSTFFDPLNIPSELHLFKPINVIVMMSEFKVSKKLIQSTLWGKSGKKKKAKKKVAKAPVDNTPGTKILLPQVMVTLNGKRIFVADKQISLDSTINIFRDEIKSKDFTLRYDRGKIVTDFNTKIHNTKNIHNTFNLNFKNIEVEAFNAFFPPYLSELKGNFVGKVNGSATLAKTLTYKVNAKMKGTKGEIKNFNVAAVLGPLLENVKLLKGKIPKKQNVSDKFDLLYADVKATEKLITVNRLEIDGAKKQSELIAYGKVSMLDKKSEIKGTIYTSQVAAQMKKEMGKTKIPYLMSGKGFVLIPSAKYTTDKLLGYLKDHKIKAAKKEFKKKKKVAQKKFNKKVKKEKKKLQKKLEDELKKKLKGFKL